MLAVVGFFIHTAGGYLDAGDFEGLEGTPEPSVSAEPSRDFQSAASAGVSDGSAVRALALTATFEVREYRKY